MYLLPLVTRELKVALRRPWTVRLRKWMGGGTMAGTVWAFLVWGGSGASTGEKIFQFFTLLAAAACMITGIFLSSDSISREKREGTLGFLFLTDLYAPDVILGKISAAGVVPMSLLLAMFPGFAVCQFAGGVPLGEFWRTMAALLLTLAFVLSATVYISSYSTSNRQSYGWASVLLLVLNPIWLCLSAFDANYRSFFWAGIPIYWYLFGGFLLLTLLFIADACRVVDRNWRDKEKVRLSREKKAAVRWFGRKILDEKPIAWLMLRRREISHRTDLIIITTLAVGFALLIPMTFDSEKKYWFLGLLFALHLGYELIILARTSYSFYLDRQDGSLELLLGTRLATSELFEGFFSYLLHHSRSVLVLLSCVDLVSSISFLANGDVPSAAFPFAMGVTLWCTVLGFGWLGVYRSLMTNHPLHAMAATFFRLSFFPLAVTTLFLFSPRATTGGIMVFWIVSTAFIGLFFGMESRTALLKHGRKLLMRPYNEKPPHIESELSFINWEEEMPKPPPLPQIT